MNSNIIALRTMQHRLQGGYVGGHDSPDVDSGRCITENIFHSSGDAASTERLSGLLKMDKEAKKESTSESQIFSQAKRKSSRKKKRRSSSRRGQETSEERELRSHHDTFEFQSQVKKEELAKLPGKSWAVVELEAGARQTTITDPRTFNTPDSHKTVTYNMPATSSTNSKTKTKSSVALTKTFVSESVNDPGDFEQNDMNKLRQSRGISIDDDMEQPSYPAMKDNDLDFTNDPHPSLETPFLYFLLCRSPRVLGAIHSFYNLRWDVSSPLQNRIPGSRCLRKVKIIFTWSELFLLLPFFAAMVASTFYCFVEPNIFASGHTSRTPLIFAFVTAMRNNLLTFFLGMPIERAIKYHKLAARIAYINGLLHTYVAFKYPVHESSNHFLVFLFEDQCNSGGTMLIVFMTGIIITSIPYIRKKLFELFYYVHILFAIFMMACAFFHTGILVPILVSLTWGLDLFVRKIYMPFLRYPRKAKLQIISDTVVELSFPKQAGFDFNAGQYVYIAVPKLNILDWHPFSLSSSPKQKVVTIHIRKAGDWTTSLYELAENQREVDILMEGPYGSLGIDLGNPYKYQTVMLFSGGIGVTPMQSLCNSLMYEHNHGLRRLRKLSFVWIERDPVIMPEVDVVRRESVRCIESSRGFDLEEGSDEISPPSAFRSNKLWLASQHDADGASTLATHLLALVPQSRMTDLQLAHGYPSEEFDLGCDDEEDDIMSEAAVEAVLRRKQNVETKLTGDTHHRISKRVSFKVLDAHPSWGAGDEMSADQSFLDHAFQATDADDSPLDLQVYLTSKKVAKTNEMAQMPFVKLGRPDIKNLFHQARHDALRHGHARVAVCVCAPSRIVNLCRKACAKYSDRYVAFDFHYEVFE